MSSSAAETKQLLIYGSQDYSALVRDIAQDCGWTVAGYIDDSNKSDEILGTYSFVKDNFSKSDYSIALGIGYNNLSTRNAVVKSVMGDDWSMPKLVHPRAVVHPSAQIGCGTVVMLGAIIDVRAQVGIASVCWPGSVISHDSSLGNNCFLSPNATLCGFVRTGDSCFFGAGSIVTDHLDIPDNQFLKAGERYRASDAGNA